MKRSEEIEIDAPQPKRKGEAPKKKRERPKWLRALCMVANAIVLIVNIGIGLGMLCSGYAQTIAPSSWPIATAVAMTFGWWFGACVLVFAIDLLWWRRTAWIAGLCMLACLGPINDFCPLNLPNFRMNDEEKARSFSLMTYNVYRFIDYREKGAAENRQMDFILREQPDIVCIQEASYLSPNENNGISQRQLDSLHIVYPYVMTQGNDFAILSKFETKPVNINFPRDSFPSGDMAAWRVFVDGRVLNLFSVHLRSFSLSPSEKERYRDIVKLDSVGKKELYEMRFDIMPKIKSAAVDREEQIRYLEKYLAKYGGVNAIVCGDFNDPVCSYPLYSLERNSKLKQAYADAGFGPAITYNANLLFFRIDHILYRGHMRPWRVKRPGIDASDHYPLQATFIFDE